MADGLLLWMLLESLPLLHSFCHKPSGELALTQCHHYRLGPDLQHSASQDQSLWLCFFHPLFCSREKRDLAELGIGESEMYIVFASFLNELVSNYRLSHTVFHLTFPLPLKDKCVVKEPTAPNSASWSWQKYVLSLEGLFCGSCSLLPCFLFLGDSPEAVLRDLIPTRATLTPPFPNHFPLEKCRGLENSYLRPWAVKRCGWSAGKTK